MDFKLNTAAEKIIIRVKDIGCNDNFYGSSMHFSRMIGVKTGKKYILRLIHRLKELRIS